MNYPTVSTLSSDRFLYTPPPSALSAKQILIKPNLGYPVPHPVTVSLHVLTQVLQGIQLANPKADILIVEGVCSARSLNDIAAALNIQPLIKDKIHLLDADTLPLTDYPNRCTKPVRFSSMWAPSLLQEVDCRISIGAFKSTQLKGETLISASLKNLYGLFPRSRYKARSPNSRGQLHRPSVPLILQDVYGCIGHLFDAGVVDATYMYNSPDWKPDRSGAGRFLNQVIVGSSLLAVDQAACELAQVPTPSYIEGIRQNYPAAV
ncbi:MAG: DUF362 domain-containing protein [Leptolyngbya sp. DLM2.Bin15]|nr:MAG: DUF362 domain-containing protein [Leptolyngbya sp. DLM2.Bin15]